MFASSDKLYCASPSLYNNMAESVALCCLIVTLGILGMGIPCLKQCWPGSIAMQVCFMLKYCIAYV